MAADHARHKAYFMRCVRTLPHQYTGADTTRMTLLFFALAALDLLDCISSFSESEKAGIIRWVYSQQILPESADDDCVGCGFRGAPFLGDGGSPRTRNRYDVGHVTMTYNALQILLILGDDLSRVDRRAIAKGLAHLQNPDGSFAPYEGSNECDMRFVYCACAVSAMLNDWSGVDRESVERFILASQSYQAAFGQRPNEEGHAGSTFCAVASLALMQRLDVLASAKSKLLQWCVLQQEKGFHGRTNKVDDTCYSFWVGATLAILGHLDLINKDANESFLWETQTPYGGYGKTPGIPPDLLHSYMGIASRSMAGADGLQPLDPSLNVSQRVARRVQELARSRD
ncbi:terpenoid cyclases/protein prenyltransferase alpha-alpha toroid [Hyaloraphidium curvatum]|nr:terpenoid cyclases/protein prenyltransferase alpha-alpha toroid [Hyaloraphidium curvatum]